MSEQPEQPDAELKDRFVAFDAIPWLKLPDDAIRTKLQRYVTERQENTFGVYMGDHRSGTVRAVSH